MEKIITIDTPPKPPGARRLAANGLRAKALVLTNEDKQVFL